MMFIEANLDGLVFMIFLIMFGPAVLFVIIGLMVRKKNKKSAKVFYILAGIYLVISLGVCGALIA